MTGQLVSPYFQYIDSSFWVSHGHQRAQIPGHKSACPLENLMADSSVHDIAEISIIKTYLASVTRVAILSEMSCPSVPHPWIFIMHIYIFVAYVCGLLHPPLSPVRGLRKTPLRHGCAKLASARDCTSDETETYLIVSGA